MKTPKDLIFSDGFITLQFAAWYMAYDKGAGAGCKVKIKTNIGEDRTHNDTNLFGRCDVVSINFQEMLGILSYKDLMDLSDWAKKAAEFMKEAEIKYRGEKNFEQECKANQLKQKA